MPDLKVPTEGFEWYDILKDLSMYTFQPSSRLFLLKIVNLGSRRRHKRIIIDITRKIIIYVICL